MGELAAAYLVLPTTSDWATPGYYSCCSATVRESFQECSDEATFWIVTHDLTCSAGCGADIDLGPTYPVGVSTRFTFHLVNGTWQVLRMRERCEHY